MAARKRVMTSAVDETAVKTAEVVFSELEIAKASRLFEVAKLATPREFGLEKSRSTLISQGCPNSQVSTAWDYRVWTKGWADKPGVLSRAEAQFLFCAATSLSRLNQGNPTKGFMAELNSYRPDVELSKEELSQRYKAFWSRVTPQFWSAAGFEYFLFLYAELTSLVDAAKLGWDTIRTRAELNKQFQAMSIVVDGEESKKQWQDLKSWAQQELKKSWAKNEPTILTYSWLLRWAGDEAAVISYLDEFFVRPTRGPQYMRTALDLIYSIPTVEIYQKWMKKIFYAPDVEDFIRWYVRCGADDIGWLAYKSTQFRTKADFVRCLKMFARVKAKDLAAYMFDVASGEVCKDASAIAIANQWLMAAGENVVPALIPIATGRTKRKELAIRILAQASRMGAQRAIEDGLVNVGEKAKTELLTVLASLNEKDSQPDVEQTAQNLEQTSSIEVKNEPNGVGPKNRLTRESYPEWLFETTKKKAPAFVSVEVLPQMYSREGAPIDAEVTGAFVKQLASLAGDSQDLPPKGEFGAFFSRLKKVAERFSVTSGNQLCDYLIDALVRDGGNKPTRWATMILAFFVSERAIVNLAQFLSKKNRTVYSTTESVIPKLKYHGSPLAQWYLVYLAYTATGRTRSLLFSAMQSLAKQKGVGVDEFCDSVFPGEFLDERGGVTFDYGPRQFRWVVRGVNEYAVFDEEGHPTKTLPPGKSTDSTALVNEAKRRHKELVWLFSSSFEMMCQRLVEAMVTRRGYTHASWYSSLVKHRVYSLITRGLVWGEVGADGQLIQTFRVFEDGTFADAEDNPVAVNQTHRIILVHPAELEPSTRTAFEDRFAESKIVQPFSQLERIVGLKPLPDFKTIDSMQLGTLWRELTPRGWVDALVSGDPRIFRRVFETWGYQADLTFSTVSLGVFSQGEHLICLEFRKILPDSKSTPTDERVEAEPDSSVPAVVVCEAQHDILSMLQRRLWATQVRRAHQRYSVVKSQVIFMTLPKTNLIKRWRLFRKYGEQRLVLFRLKKRLNG